MDKDDERAAREWLLEAYNDMYTSEEEASHRATILRLLDRPVCPKGRDVQDDVVRDMLDADSSRDDPYVGMRAAIDVLHAHMTAPPPAR